MKHVFITGCPRSGTTMLANLIGSNRECKASPESDYFPCAVLLPLDGSA